ncbi:hypothetical protein [Sutcliffiella rhizosphaerae]|uniref:Uncharacterized protein n=1 Tax=Sutcliffiella rhizosphaerae TaxID=2880967 RepID=A0ABN8AJM1_9BACI|nr:hypothetical protein [Sutcliffiella rhizosphaerae]CAG9623752.1 hypothetical protein BACCIP111883_04586 [Sutcliffiella rhizosphaerae]
MKIIIPVVILSLISFGPVEEASDSSLKSFKENLELFENQELSLKQAIDLTYSSALEWDENAQILQAVNIDLDKPRKSIGSNGKRKYWNISFGVPETNKLFLVTIHEGKINQAQDVTRKGDSPYPKKEFTNLEDINYDSPKLLKKL